MTMVALLMVPWIKIMREIKVEPRVLADDLMFTAAGKNHANKTIEAMNASKEYFNSIGAKIADKKCFTFSTEAATRKIFKEMIWDDKGTSIPNVNTFRDLGAHLNLQDNTHAPTVTKRFHKAAEMAQRLKCMNLPRDKKIHLVKTNILPAALYGCETGNPSMQAMQKLRSSIADIIDDASAKRLSRLQI